MIELVEGLPEHVVGVRVHGEVTRDDYERVLIPAVEKRILAGRKVPVYYELAPDFAGFSLGSVWDDMVLGIGHLTSWERVAVVTDVDWITNATEALRFMMPCPVRVFPLADADRARHWVASGRE